ncbi:MAG: DinB family protein [Acidobacteria bacterium]|nr:DinB family protein [Acidobacteriota bacterium]
MKTIKQDDFTSSLFALLTETFESKNTAFGTLYLDQGTGFFDTIGGIDAAKASRAVNGATIAAHCEHVRFYLEFLTNYMNENFKMADWQESWKTKTVTDAEWTALRGQLQKAYQKVTDVFNEVETWNDFKISGALGILAHTAYHLSAIRQLLKNI